MVQTFDAELDCKGLLCPMPVYRTAQALEKMLPGQILKIECTDPGSLADFPALARQRGHTLLSVEAANGIQVFYIRKEAAA